MIDFSKSNSANSPVGKVGFNKKAISKAIALAVISTSPLPTTVQAQEQNYGLEEIVVTARKREESIQDTPISITAFSASELEARQLDSVSQIGESTPNLVFEDAVSLSGSSASSSVFIRGVGQLDFTFNADPGVGTYVDGVYISRSIGGLVNLLDVERVEVLRGPQGTLFGKNTNGGAVSITSARPSDDFEGKVGLTVGEFDRAEVYGSINAPISDTLRSRFSVSKRDRDGYATRVDGEDFGDKDALSGRAVFNWTPNDAVSVDFSFDATRERQGSLPLVLIGSVDETAVPFAGFFNGAIAGGAGCVPPPSSLNNPACFNSQFVLGEFESAQGAESVSDLDLFGASVAVAWDLNENVTFKSITALRDFESRSSIDIDGSPFSIFDDIIEQDFQAFSQEFQLLGSAFDNRLNWIVGAYYLDEDTRHLETITTAPFTFTSGGDVINESTAVFVQGTYDLTDRLSLTAGIRYTDETRVFTPDAIVLESILPPFPVGTEFLPSRDFETESDEVTPMLNLNYAFTENLNTYLTYSEGFKSGGFAQRIAAPNPAPPAFSPEFVEVVEAGFKYTSPNSRFRLNASVFQSDYTDIQVLGSIPGVVGVATTNAGEAEISGLEIETSFLASEGLLLQAGIGVLDAEYTSLLPTVVGVSLDDSLPSAPDLTANFSISYDIQLNSGHTVTPRIDWFYTDDLVNVSGGSPMLNQPSYDLLNASIAFETADSKWRVVLSGKNLTDEVYLVSGNDTPATGTVYGTYGIPRTWALNAEFRF